MQEVILKNFFEVVENKYCDAEKLLNRIVAAQECDATDAEAKNIAGLIKIKIKNETSCSS